VCQSDQTLSSILCVAALSKINSEYLSLCEMEISLL